MIIIFRDGNAGYLTRFGLVQIGFGIRRTGLKSPGKIWAPQISALIRPETGGHQSARAAPFYY
jgi:hypothetical protein